MTEKEQGELAVSVSGGWVRIVEADNGAAFAPIHLKIDYELVVGGEAVEGIVFRRPGDAGDENVS
jgi:transcription initiation factor TFIID subunit 2